MKRLEKLLEPYHIGSVKTRNRMIKTGASMMYWHQATKYVQDIAGGIVATVPSAKDYYNPETHDIMEKYFGGREGIPTEHRLKVIKLIKDSTSVYEDVLTIHAEGSLAAQQLSIYALADFERYKAAAKRAARIKDGTEHPIFSQLPEFPPGIA
jgi:4-hydroxybutyryl-CoA dehydratase/vinylacetyl-CoA-Delta-isomerase